MLSRESKVIAIVEEAPIKESCKFPKVPSFLHFFSLCFAFKLRGRLLPRLFRLFFVRRGRIDGTLAFMHFLLQLFLILPRPSITFQMHVISPRSVYQKILIHTNPGNLPPFLTLAYSEKFLGSRHLKIFVISFTPFFS